MQHRVLPFYALLGLLFIGLPENLQAQEALAVGPRDIIFLLDTTMGATLLNSTQKFIQRFVNTMPIGAREVQVGVAQFGTSARTEFDLNTHGSREAILAALRHLRPRKGRTVNIGAALDFVRTNMLRPDRGSRRVPQLVLLMTTKRSSDNVDEAARALQQMGVLTLAAGSKRANEDELKRIAFNDSMVFMQRDFRMLLRNPRAVVDALSSLSGTVVTEEPMETETLSLGRKDIIFLIDGSDNTGASGIDHIRDFILNIVQQLDVQPEQVRVGVVQYADRVKTEFSLNSHNNKAAVLSAVKRLRQMGGRSSDLADAINYVIQNELKVSAGLRPAEASQHLVVVTAGRSPQNVEIFGPLLKSSRVNCIGIGASGADSRQLTQIATSSEDVIQVPTFPSLPSIRERFISRLSGRIEEIPTEIGGDGEKKADIVFLIDSSINVGKSNFGEVMNFVINLIDLFYNERDQLRFALAHYATDVTDVFFLNSFQNKDDIISAIGRAEYKGGRRINTGAALRHVQDQHFIKSRGSRRDEGTPQILILITGGRSADDSKTAALGLKRTGARIFAVGVGDILDELENLASESSTVARASTYLELSELNEQILQALDDEVNWKSCTCQSSG